MKKLARYRVTENYHQFFKVLIKYLFLLLQLDTLKENSINVTKTGFIEKNITEGPVTETLSPNITESHIHNNTLSNVV